MIDENEISTLKSKINTLENVLKKCELHKARLEAIFFKKNTSKKHVHATHAHTSKSQHIHTHKHAYPHTYHPFIYRVYSCTYCDRKCHLAKFYFDRIYTSNNHVWIKETNIIGPKKIWYQNQRHSFDIGTHQGSKT